MGIPSRFARTILTFLGGRLAVLAITMLAAGWLIMGPVSIARHATESPFRVDSLAFDAAAQILRDGDGARLYDPALHRAVEVERAGHADEGFTVYLNPPIVGAAFIPLAGLSARGSYAATTMILAAAMAAVFALMLALLRPLPRGTRWIAATCACGSTACASALISGQLTPFLLLSVFGALALFRSDRSAAAGGVLALLCIKPHFAVIALVVLLTTRQWKAAAWMLGGSAVLALASFALVGPDGATGYASLLRTSFTDPARVFIDVRSEQNLRGLMATLFQVYSGWPLHIASNAISLAVLAAAVHALRRADGEGDERLLRIAALGAVLACAASPHIQYYDLALLTLPALYVVRRGSFAPADVRPCFYGVLALLVFWVEVAGILAGAKMSVSVVPLLATAAAVIWWPAVERWLVAGAADATPTTIHDARALSNAA